MDTQEWLREELEEIEAIEPSTKSRLGSGWRTRRAQQLIIVIMRRWAPLAAKLGVAPDEVATAALEAWRQASFTIPLTHDAWAWTGYKVKRLIVAEQQAELFLTTPGGRNVRITADAPIPARYDPTDREALARADAGASAASTDELALEIAARFLTSTGMPEVSAWRLIDEMTGVVLGDDFETRDGRPTGLSGRKSVVTTLQRDRDDIAERAGTTSEIVAGLTKLLFGSRERGGLLELRLSGGSAAHLADYVARFAAKTAKN